MRVNGPRSSAPPPSRPWLVYLLRCADGTLYAGATCDLERRLAAHRRGAVKYTRGRRPVELVYHEVVGAHGSALRRESALKRLRREQKLALVLAFRQGVLLSPSP